MSGFLTDLLRDLIAVIGVLGVVATLVGLWLAYVQLRKTETAALAAKQAAENTESLGKRHFNRYAIANAHRFVHEAKNFVEQETWQLAALRISDLADQVAQIAHVAVGDRVDWSKLAGELRGWETTLSAVAAGDKPFSTSMKTKWRGFAKRLVSTLDHYYGPFTPLN